jgi:DNA-binding CsgD family transcriptional regulator
MPLNSSRSNILASSPMFNNTGRLDRLQVDLVSEALRRAVDDAGAAMAHQLGEPLTALLLYLHEIKRVGEQSEGGDDASSPFGQTVDMALRETERVCEIIGRIGRVADEPVDAEAAVARGSDAIAAWAGDNRVRTDAITSPAVRRAGSHPLTPREREVLTLITGGCSNKEGGHRLGISTRTFEAHRAHLMGKLGARNAADLVRAALGKVQ